MAPMLLPFVLAVALAAGENHSLEDTTAYIQQRLQPARPTRWGADWTGRGACQAVVFDAHNRQQADGTFFGGEPPYQMNLAWRTDSCQRLADPPTYKMRSGTFWAHGPCMLVLFETESCSGTANMVTRGSGTHSFFVVKSRVHPEDDEGRFFKSARCYCSGVSGFMRLQSNASEEEIVEQETAEGAEEAAADEESEGGLQEGRGEEAEELSEDMITNSSSQSGDFRGSRACLWHSYSGGQFQGDDFAYFFNIPRSTSPFDRRKRKNLCLTRFPPGIPDRFSVYAMVDKGCELWAFSGEVCAGRFVKLIDSSNSPDREAGMSRLVAPFWDWKYTKSIQCWCNGLPVSR